MRLDAGGFHGVTVDPRKRHVDSSIDVCPGEVYAFAASGKWRDAGKVCCPDGWGDDGFLSRWRALNRLPGRNYLLLCGNLDRVRSTYFAIGSALAGWTVPDRAGTGAAPWRLFFFANDVPGMYWNNSPVPPSRGGPLEVRVTRVS